MKATLKKVVMVLTIAVVLAASFAPAVSAKNIIALKSIALSAAATNIGAGASTTLKVKYNPTNTNVSKKVTWTSSNSAVATVSASGKVVAKKAGTANITATVGTKKATCKVTVKNTEKYVSTTAAYTQLNKYRTNAKLKGLTKDNALEKIAKQRAKELVTKYSHTRPNGTSCFTLVPGNLYKGENIARGQTSCAAVSTAWYNSAGHKANMLSKNYKKVGIAGYEYNGVMYWVQVFTS